MILKQLIDAHAYRQHVSRRSVGTRARVSGCKDGSHPRDLIVSVEHFAHCPEFAHSERLAYITYMTRANVQPDGDYTSALPD